MEQFLSKEVVSNYKTLNLIKKISLKSLKTWHFKNSIIKYRAGFSKHVKYNKYKCYNIYLILIRTIIILYVLILIYIV